MATTSVNPLDLAEIVATVLSYVEGKGSLFACVQVNKLWAEEATTCLWSNSPPLGALRTMPSYVRQQHYASKVVKLRVSYLKPRIHQQLTTLQFSRLAYLYISECHDYDGSSALQYLQPALREFECGREVSDSILRHLAVSQSHREVDHCSYNITRSVARGSNRYRSSSIQAMLVPLACRIFSPRQFR